MSHMMYSIQIDQPTALEWGLNAQQALVFSLIHQLPTWADTVQINGETWYHLSKNKLVQELPLLTDRPDTAWRYLKQLVAAGVIETTTIGNRTHVRVTEKGRAWNRTQVGENSKGRKNLRPSEKPQTPGNSSDPRKDFQGSEESPPEVGKISEPGSEKSPTDEYYHNHNHQDQYECADLAVATSSPAEGSAGPDYSPNPTDQDALEGELVETDREHIVPGWYFASLIDPPEQDPNAGTFIALPLRADQFPPVHFVTDQDVINLQQTYRGIDVPDEFRLMLGWLVGNPGKRKTMAGIRKFITGWLNRAKATGGSPYGRTATHLTGYDKQGTADPKAKRQRVREALRDIEDTNW